MKPVPTPSDATPSDATLSDTAPSDTAASDGATAGPVPDPAGALRHARSTLLADTALVGDRFGQALASNLDRVLRGIVERSGVEARVALVALGSYAREELCPGSDVDLLLVHAAGRRHLPAVRDLAEALWYPLWDAGFVTGHGTRTVRESLALADDEPDALTAMLEVRGVAGDPALAGDLERRARDLAFRRGDRLRTVLATASAARRDDPGPVAEMLEPDLKDGSGGLRDLQALAWAGWTLGGPGGLDALEARGYLTAEDRERLRAARRHLLAARVALHRVTGGRSDRLVLQEQDQVAVALGDADADVLVRRLAAAARDVAWIARDCWSRLGDPGPAGRTGATDRPVAPGVVLRDGRVALVAGAPGPGGPGTATTPPPSASAVLEAAAIAAERGVPFDRATLDRLAGAPAPTWDVWERAALLRLLRSGAQAVPVFEALDHAGALARILPEWEHVRSHPQRNAYHRFTVDRHLLEAVAECASLLDAGDGPDRAPPGPGAFDAVVARACRRPELLLLGALLHDLGKGYPGDHSTVGASLAAAVTTRIGLDAEGREIVTWLVRDHLVMADAAMRRDLSDPAVIERFVEGCAGDPERLRLLYLLTIGDSRATGPAAWSRTKAALLRDLFVKAAHVIEDRGAGTLADERAAALAARIGADAAVSFLRRLPPGYPHTFDVEEMVDHRDLLTRHGVTARAQEDGRVVVTVAAPDRPGLLATLAGALTVAGLSVQEAMVSSTSDGMTLDVFRAVDAYGRFAEHGEARVCDLVTQALRGELDVDASVAERARAYGNGNGSPVPVEVAFDLEASDRATIVEIHAADSVGLLHRVARAFADLGLDVELAKVSTLGDRVVDVFYVRDAARAKVVDPRTLVALERALVDRLGDDGAGTP